MPLLQATIATDRAGRYLTQFCKHAAAMGSDRAHRIRAHRGGPAEHDRVGVTAEWTDATGSVVFDKWGSAELHASPDTLLIRLRAVDDEAADRIRTIVDNNLRRFGRRQLAVEWRPVTPDPAAEG